MSDNAYWLSPRGLNIDDNDEGKIIKPESRHILTVVNHPEDFGETDETLDATFAKYGEPKHSNIEGKAREEILLRVIGRGYIRIRTNGNRRSQHWSVQLNRLDKHSSDIIWMWAKKLSAEPGQDKFADVVIHELGRNDKMTRTSLDKIASGATIGETFVNGNTGENFVMNEEMQNKIVSGEYMMNECTGEVFRTVKVYAESELRNVPRWIDYAHKLNQDSLSESAKIEIMAHQMNNGQI